MIGTGFYSTSLAKILQTKKENEIVLWTEQKAIETKFKKTHKFDFLDKKITFDSNVSVTSSIEDALKDASAVFILVSSKFFEETIKNIKPYYKKNIPIYVGTKGMLFKKNNIYFSSYTRRILKCNSYTFFAGPTFAADLLLDYPCYFTCAGSNKIGYKKLAKIFPEKIEYEYSEDLNGLELLSTLKNIYALGSGILHGLNVPEGIYYGYITKVTQEIMKLLNRNFSDPETLYTYAGLGDLLMTTNSKNSRNYTLGFMIGSNKKKDEIKKYKKNTTIEGLENLKNMQTIITKWKMKNTLIEKIYRIIEEEENPNILLVNEEKEKDDFLN